VKRRILALILIFSLTSASAISATGSMTINGPTGLVRMPSAIVLSSKDWNAGIDYIFDNALASSISNLSDISGSWSYKMNIGADMGPDKGMELGFVGRTEKVTNRFKEGVLINLKYALSSSNDPYALSMAIGVENLTATMDSDAYIVASKYFKGGFGIHFGAMFDFPSNMKVRPLGMLGADIPVSGNDLKLLADLFSGESVFQVNAGMRYNFNKTLSLLIRGLNVTNSTTAKDYQVFSAGFCMTTPF